MLVIVQSPNSLAPGWLKPEHALQFPHHAKVSCEDFGDHSLLVFLLEDSDQAQDEEVGEEGQFVTRSIIESSGGSERREEVVR